jgi:hypothetical protein
MKVQELEKLLEGLNPESEIKIGGWRETNRVTNYVWDSVSLQDKHFDFSRDFDGKVTVHLEFEV